MKVAPSRYQGISARGRSLISSTTYDGATKFAKGRTDGASMDSDEVIPAR